MGCLVEWLNELWTVNPEWEFTVETQNVLFLESEN